MLYGLSSGRNPGYYSRQDAFKSKGPGKTYLIAWALLDLALGLIVLCELAVFVR